jgi:predicted nucleic acid-binding protein
LTLLDSNALISLLRREPAGPEVAGLLRSRECATPTTCVTEVVDIMLRVSGADPERLSERLGALLDESVDVLELGTSAAWRAGRLRAEHYDRKDTDLSLADCVLLANAGPDDEIATSDHAVAVTARRLGIDVIPLQDSKGRRPLAD